jgi:pectinesterase
MVYGQAPSTTGITGVSDTSYSLQSAYRSTLKSFPAIVVVTDTVSHNIKQRQVTYCQVNGVGLTMDVFSPRHKSLNKRIAVILVHGGGWRSGSPSLHHPLAQRLALMGYVCFTPQYRLSTHALYPAAVHDLKAAVSWVRANAKRWQVDTNAIAVAGHSAGGELAAFLGATNGMHAFDSSACRQSAGSWVNAVLDMDGILAFIHPESGEGDDSKRTSAATYWFGYSKEQNPALWIEGSPLTHAGKSAPPVLFINSSVARMQAGQKDYIEKMKQHGTYWQVVDFPEAPHNFPLFRPWFQPTLLAIDSFLKQVFHEKN